MTDLTKDRIWLDTLDISRMTCGWGDPQPNKTVQGNPLTIRGTVFDRGVGTHADSIFIADLKGAAKRFSAVVGIDDEVRATGASRFEVWLDDKQITDTGVLTSNHPPFPICVDLLGGTILKLVVKDEINETDWAHADWCDAFIEMVPGADEIPVYPHHLLRPSAPPRINRQVAILPEINHPRIVGATPGRPFLFKVPAAGKGPLSYCADGLPEGLVLDGRTGIISGVIAGTCENRVRATVRNAHGSCVREIIIAGGKDRSVRMPPMGWNSWNAWGLSVDQDKVRAAADALIDTGLSAHGFAYVNIDDGWEGERDAGGCIVPNGKFGDMKQLSDYIHAKGLKFGIYSSPGPLTCGKFAGSYEHEEQDALTYAQWGVDYLKYDWCTYEDIAKDKSREEQQKPYRIMSRALQKCDRDIVFSLCSYGGGRVWEWGREIGGHLWRTTGDINDSWWSMSGIGFRQHPHHPFAGSGGWNDPDMLVVGWLGWGPDLHETRLTKHEQLTHISLWCMLSAPLLLGCDLARMDDWTLALLTNDEVIALDQDPMGKQARRVKIDELRQIWIKPLHDGSHAVGIFNLAPGAEKMTVAWEEIGLQGPLNVRDLWLRENLGEFGSEFTIEVASHGVVLIKVSAAGA
jgi:alpha-galactosidase